MHLSIERQYSMPTSATSKRRVLTHMWAMFSHTVVLLISLTAAYALSMSPTVRCNEKSSSAAVVFSSTYITDGEPKDVLL